METTAWRRCAAAARPRSLAVRSLLEDLCGRGRPQFHLELGVVAGVQRPRRVPVAVRARGRRPGVNPGSPGILSGESAVHRPPGIRKTRNA
ncbi:hypothetical protein QJS66_06665 [Kocuria rhizophila]|nr:hypothetical protein QJS66_06665 [Kocuria rhizophila]